MTFADWATDTRHRIASDPLPTALADSAREFYCGAVARYYADSNGPYRTEIAGVSARFRTETPTDVKRARDLNGEAAVAEFLFGDGIEDRVFWDVGGYHGHYSVLAACAGATVVTFEPDTLNRRRIATNADLNDVDLDVRPVALSDTVGEAAWGGECGSELAVGEGAETVETIRGDQLDRAPDIVKVDVEGHEAAVLDGMGAALRLVERIAVEVHEGRGVDRDAIAARLRDAGLSVVELDTGRSQPHLGGIR